MSRFGPGTMMAVIFAILIGLGGAYTVRQLLKEPPPKKQAARPPKRIVPTVAYDLPAGRVVALTDIIPIPMTDEQFKKSKFAPLAGKFMNNVQQLVGRRLKNPIPEGNTIAVTDLWPEGMGGPDLEKMLKPGYLAKPLPISEGDPILTYIAPGSKVDVYFRSTPISATGNEEGSGSATTAVPSRTFTLLESVEVLDVEKVPVQDRQFRRINLVSSNQRPTNRTPQMRVRNVTVMVSDYQAKALAMVEGQGELRLALRNRTDFSTASPASAEKQMTIGQLLGLPTGVSSKGMAIYKGGTQENVIFNRKPTYDERFHIRTPVPPQPPAEPKKKAKSALGS